MLPQKFRVYQPTCLYLQEGPASFELPTVLLRLGLEITPQSESLLRMLYILFTSLPLATVFLVFGWEYCLKYVTWNNQMKKLQIPNSFSNVTLNLTKKMNRTLPLFLWEMQ